MLAASTSPGRDTRDTGYHAADQIAFILRTVGANAILNLSNEFQPASSFSAMDIYLHVYSENNINVFQVVGFRARHTQLPVSDETWWGFGGELYI